MAITWEVKITPISVAKKLADISGTVTDSEEPEDDTITVRISRAKLNTSQEQLLALDRLYSRYQSALVRNETIATWLADKENQAKTNLEARG